MRITVAQYHSMLDAGVFANDEKVELLEGWLVPKISQKPAHPTALELLGDGLRDRLPSGWVIRVQAPITTGDSEPEPDIGVARGPRRAYVERHPTATDLGMIVEVSDTTLARDRGVKKRIYARASIPIYWIVNLSDRCIEVYTGPSGPTKNPDYAPPQIYGENDQTPIVLDGVEIGRLEVKSILP